MHRALKYAAPHSMWLDDPSRPGPSEPLTVDTEADLVIVGGGYTGLWTALRARERYPDLDVLLIEAGECGWQGSGRNGGFVDTSLTHGFGNGQERWPAELEELDRQGVANVDAIEETCRHYEIDCNFERTGGLDVATAPHQVEQIAELIEARRAAGDKVSMLDAAQVRALVNSPTYLAAAHDPDGVALLEPARLVWGLRRVCLDLGVRIHEQTMVADIDETGSAVRLTCAGGAVVRAGRVALATNGFPPLLRRLRLMTVPVYDYVLGTEPLSSAQLASIGWEGRHGVGDAANLFHYYRLTRDNRILWGGYDAVYRYGSAIKPEFEQAGRTHELLAEQFFETFPQLEGLGFAHRWAGVIDTCTRFAAFFGTAHSGRTAYAVGYTGLGVAATRFGAEVMLDLLYGEDTERTRLSMVRERPLPFPPEPFRAIGINLTRWSLARSDEGGGRRNLWLKGLDAVGLGFDS